MKGCRLLTKLGSNSILLLLFPWHLCRQWWCDHDFRVRVFLPLTFVSLRSLLAVTNPSICCTFSLFFSHSFYMSLLMQSPIAISVFLATFPVHFLISQTWTFSCCFSVSAVVSSPFMYAAVTHEPTTFPLSLRDTHLSPITPKTFLQAFAPAVTLPH